MELALPEQRQMIMMSVQTNKANELRRYFCTLEELFNTYILYQVEYDNRRKNEELTSISTENAAVLAETRARADR